MTAEQPTIAVTRADLPGDGVDRLREVGNVRVWPTATGPTASELPDFLADADAALTMSQDQIDATVLAAAPRLRVIGQASAGFDNLDLAALTSAGVHASNAPGVLNETTADFTWALYFALQRRVAQADAFVRGGHWTDVRFDLLLGRDLHGTTLGIVGYGQIGKAVARRAAGFAMDVIHTDPYAGSDEHSTRVEFDELLTRADIVSLHTVLTTETRHLIAAPQLAAMKPSAVLVNASRGPVVDEWALVEALRAGTIAGAALDVFEPEPIGADHPLVAMPNCVLTPHIASASEATRARMVSIAADNVLAGLRGEQLPNLLNRQVAVR